jgi:hypothetical protein
MEMSRREERAVVHSLSLLSCSHSPPRISIWWPSWSSWQVKRLLTGAKGVGGGLCGREVRDGMAMERMEGSIMRDRAAVA